MERDLDVRLRAFRWLTDQIHAYGDVLPRSLLEQGFEYQGSRVPLVSPQGIFKPKLLDLPLTITTTPGSPYDDDAGGDQFLRYRYRGTNPGHPDNTGLRRVMQLQRPLIYFLGLVPGRYLAVWPVFVVADDPVHLVFTVAADEAAALNPKGMVLAEGDRGKRAYLTTIVKQRLHQRNFRERVLLAYRDQCSVCRLRHRQLLDAAHIIPDHEPNSRATVDNGLALCKFHHAAFDAHMLGITPHHEIRVRRDIRQERDGPLLTHGLQELHGASLLLPSRRVERPAQDALEWRYRRFLDAEG